jgi:hypothetical protein
MRLARWSPLPREGASNLSDGVGDDSVDAITEAIGRCNRPSPFPGRDCFNMKLVAAHITQLEALPHELLRSQDGLSSERK